jgi:hypothetical protein
LLDCGAPPNGKAQRQRRDWRDSFSIMHHFRQNAPVCKRRSRCPLEPVLGVFVLCKTHRLMKDIAANMTKLLHTTQFLSK